MKLALLPRIVPYYVAKQKLSELQHFSTALGLKILAQQTELVLAGGAIEVIRRAVPRFTPVSPNRSFAGILVCAGVLCGILGLALVRGRRA